MNVKSYDPFLSQTKTAPPPSPLAPGGSFAGLR
jgi:hypothetical protein